MATGEKSAIMDIIALRTYRTATTATTTTTTTTNIAMMMMMMMMMVMILPLITKKENHVQRVLTIDRSQTPSYMETDLIELLIACKRHFRGCRALFEDQAVFTAISDSLDQSF
uniref:Uncharacterized protein n=1 Tax=Glossina austeni TaxID=7395 RepID=A0A1A9UVQ5_GLOAU